MKRAFERILLVDKTTRLERVTPKIHQLVFHHSHFYEGLYLAWKKSMLAHMTNANVLFNYLKTVLKREVIVRKDLHLKRSDFEGIDLVVSVGGDGTFLRASSFVTNDTPIVGFNSDPHRSTGALCSSYLDDSDQDPMKYAFACLDNGHYQEVNRTRIEANIWERDKLTSYYALNEIFTGEKHIGQTSSFCLKVDGVEMGRYRSSGLVISTGTGSTGWLMSAKAIEMQDIHKILQTMNLKTEYSRNELEDYCYKVNSQISFPPEYKYLFYHVREPTGFKEIPMKPHSYQGQFFTKISIESQLLDGIVVFDGYEYKQLAFGDTFEAQVANTPLITLQFDFDLN